MVPGDEVQTAREDLAAAYRLAEKFGFNEGIDNHFTMAVPEQNDQFFLIPYGLHWSEVTASKLMIVGESKFFENIFSNCRFPMCSGH